MAIGVNMIMGMAIMIMKDVTMRTATSLGAQSF